MRLIEYMDGYMTVEELRASQPLNRWEQEEREARLRLHELLSRQEDITEILYTADPYSAYDLLITSGDTPYMVEVKERGSGYSSTYLREWFLETSKVHALSELSSESGIKALHISTFPHEGKAMVWLIGDYMDEEMEVDAPLSNEVGAARKSKKFLAYLGREAQVIA